MNNVPQVCQLYPTKTQKIKCPRFYTCQSQDLNPIVRFWSPLEPLCPASSVGKPTEGSLPPPHPTPHQDKTLTMATGVLQPRAPNLKVAPNWRAIRHPSGSSGKGSACRVVVWTEPRGPTMTPIHTTVLPLPDALLAVVSCVLIAWWGEMSLPPFYTQGNRLRVVYAALSVLALPM